MVEGLKQVTPFGIFLRQHYTAVLLEKQQVKPANFASSVSCVL
jgi:hypothetical protein